MAGVYMSDRAKVTMHEAFNLNRPPQDAATCLIIMFGLLDMVYVFLLFWSANEFPIWLMVTLLQLFIPLNMFIRSTFMGLTFKTIHYVAGGVIISAIALNLLDFTVTDYHNNGAVTSNPFAHFVIFFIVASVIELISHSLKEQVVRSQPIDQDNFSFKVSLSQFLIGLLISPISVSMSKKYIDYSETTLDPDNVSFGTFMGDYFSYGIVCVFGSTKHDEYCQLSFVFVLGYVLAIVTMQLTLANLMKAKEVKQARKSYSVMVPLTVLAFLCASWSFTKVEGHRVYKNNTLYDFIAIPLATVGVFIYNVIDIPTQEVLIEKF
jgi:hypothetical protein